MKLLANLLGMLFSREEEEIVVDKFVHCPLCSFLGTKEEVELHLKKRHYL